MGSPTSANLAAMKKQAKHLRLHVNVPVFTITAAFTLAFVVSASVWPEDIARFFTSAVEWTGRHFGSFYIALATAVLIFVIALAASRFGQIRLGAESDTPEFSLASWAAMLFAAGISTDILFFAVAEPIAQYMTPPTGEAQTVQAARDAVMWTMFHYGVHGWGLYALMGLALAYFAFRRGNPLTLRSTLRPLLKSHTDGWVGHIVDAAAIIGGLFGLATSLGVGVVQLAVGLETVIGVSRGLSTQLALLIIGVLTACISAVSGVAKGIRILSSANIVLAGVLALYVFVTGRTVFLFDAFVANIGDLVAAIPHLSLETFAWNRPDEWLNAWTLFFWAWWIAWASFVGLFLARISRGRTIREFVIGTLTIPFAYVAIWVGIFGNSALDLVRGPHPDFGLSFAQKVLNVPEEGLFRILAASPWPMFAVILAVIVGLLFYITSADSGALVIAELSMAHSFSEDETATSKTPYSTDMASTEASQDSSNEVQQPLWLRVFWGVATGALTLAMLMAGGIPILQSATVVMALPFAFVIIAVAVCLIRELRAHEK